MSGKIIGLAGFRRVGKSEIAKYICEKHDFIAVHPFEIWKVGIEAMLTAIGATAEEADSMVRGALKDTASEHLPDNHACRYLMEHLGKWTGTSEDMGPKWTLGLSIKMLQRKNPGKSLLLESIVYEADVARQMGAHLIMVQRPGTEGTGLKTDEATRLITPDSYIINDGDDLEQLFIDVDTHLAHYGLIQHEHPCEII